MSQNKTPCAVQIRFEDVSHIRDASEHLDYFLNLPLPEEVTNNAIHRIRHQFLTKIRDIFLSCHEQYTRGVAESPGPKFGSGGAIKLGPPPDKSGA